LLEYIEIGQAGAEQSDGLANVAFGEIQDCAQRPNWKLRLFCHFLGPFGNKILDQ